MLVYAFLTKATRESRGRVLRGKERNQLLIVRDPEWAPNFAKECFLSTSEAILARCRWSTFRGSATPVPSRIRRIPENHRRRSSSKRLTTHLIESSVRRAYHIDEQRRLRRLYRPNTAYGVNNNHLKFSSPAKSRRV